MSPVLPGNSVTANTHSLIERLSYHAKNNPDHDAIISPQFTLSYQQLARLVSRQVQQFYDAGINGNAVIGIKCADDIQHLVMCLAATYIGATSCTVPSHEENHLQHAVINSCGVSHVVDDGIAVDPLSPDCVASTTTKHAPMARLLFSTSGTTGKPKLVVHHDSDLVAQAHRHIGSEQERFACLASMEHNFAKRHRLYCVAAGASNVFLDAEQDSLVAQCQSLNVNVIHVSAFQAQRLLATPDISLLANIRLKLGGSHVPVSLRQQLRENITRNLQAGYGTTETGAIAFTDPNDSKAGESVGQPLAGIEICVVSAARKPLAIGEHGELAVRCEGMFRGYLGQAELTASCLEDGWFYTGDIGYLDKQQRIHLSGRSDDMFVFNSMNIYPQDLESQICQYPGVKDIAVLPKKSAVHGNIPVALVVFDKNARPKLAALKKFSRERLGIRSPRQFIIVKDIPRNAAGKISRQAALNLTTQSEQIRKTIIEALDSRVTAELKASFIADFETGDTDITLREIAMDSLSQMDLLITLELNYDAIITPQEFARFRSLGELVARVLSLQSSSQQQSVTPLKSSSNNAVSTTGKQPYLIRFFQRIVSCCPTVAQLNKALTTLEHRLTPLDIELLHSANIRQLLIAPSAAEKFHRALSLWLDNLQSMLLDSGKSQAEPFIGHRINATVSHFTGPGTPDKKTLLICFSEVGGRTMMMPNAVLMQHTDAALYDLLIIAEPLNEGYRLGVPQLGSTVIEVIDWIAELALIGNYRSIRTTGCSAGCYPAVIAGYRLGAELAVSIGGRFHSKRQPGKILERIYTTWRGLRKRHCDRVLICYDRVIKRDRHYARVIGWLTGGSLLAIKFPHERVGHLILPQLLERSLLVPFLARTIFANMDDELITRQRAKLTLSLPDNKIRAPGQSRPARRWVQRLSANEKTRYSKAER